MANKASGAILTRPWKTLQNDLNNGTLDLTDAIIQAYTEFNAHYEEVGKDKSILKTDSDFSIEEERYMNILRYAEGTIDTSFFEEEKGKMYEKIEYDWQIESCGQDIGGLTDGVNEPELIPSEQTLRKKYQLSTIPQCYDALEGLIEKLTPSNRGNTKGLFWGIYGILEDKIEDLRQSGADIDNHYDRSQKILETARESMSPKGDLQDRIRHNSRHRQ